MATRLKGFIGSVLLAVPAFGGCAGGQTGEEGETSNCTAKLSTLALDQVSTLGFSAADVLEAVEGEHTVAFTWLASPQYPYGPESGASELGVVLRRSGGAQLSTITEDTGCCLDSVKVPVHVRLRTTGGALDETFEAVLDAPSQDSVSLIALVKADALEGSLAFDRAALGSAQFTRLQVDLHFVAGKFSGTVQAGIEQESVGTSADSAVSFTSPHLAEWGETEGPACGL